MFTADNYVRVESLEQAYELNQARNATIVGGMLWLKMSKRKMKTIIDLGDLGLNQIEESAEEFSIGCMATLRMLEMHEGLNQVYGGAFKKAVEHIVGVQFRNSATVGGSVYGRYGFSDVLTLLMALDSYVELYKGGVISLSEYVKQPYDNDVLVRVIIKKEVAKVSYLTQRLSETDFPILACCVMKHEEGWRISIGARPKKAMLISQELPMEPTKDEIEKLSYEIAENLAEMQAFETNMRGSKEYRQILCHVLVSRGMEEVMGGTYDN